MLFSSYHNNNYHNSGTKSVFIMVSQNGMVRNRISTTVEKSKVHPEVPKPRKTANLPLRSPAFCSRVDQNVDVFQRQAAQLFIPTMQVLRNRLAKYLRSDRKWLRDFLGELLGTMFLVALGDGAVAQAVLSRGTHGQFFSITFAYAMAIAFGVYISGNTSGGHINPAVTMIMVLMGRTKWAMLPLYWLAQYLGAFLGAGFVYAVYSDAINKFDGGIRKTVGANATAGIFATYPQEFLTAGSGLFDQIVGTAILTMCVFAVNDPRNVDVPMYFLPMLVGLVVGTVGMSFGFNCGFAINPARDLGPRIFTAISGWGGEVFSFRDYNWFWVPLIGPHLGAIIGTVIYMIFIGIHWPTTFVKRDYRPNTAELLANEPAIALMLTEPDLTRKNLLSASYSNDMSS